MRGGSEPSRPHKSAIPDSTSGPATNLPFWCRWSARLPEEQEVSDRYRGKAPYCGCRPRARASAFQADDAGSNPVVRSSLFPRTPIGTETRLLISPLEVRILSREPIAGELRSASGSPKPVCVSSTLTAGASFSRGVNTKHSAIRRQREYGSRRQTDSRETPRTVRGP